MTTLLREAITGITNYKMNAILNLEKCNFSNDGKIPTNFGAQVEGSTVLTIKTKHASEARTFYLDVKHFHFDEEGITLEGIVSNESELLGRCVFRLKP